MTTGTLRQALSVLARSSPFAVSTLSDTKPHDHLQRLKSYLFIEQEIEGDFLRALRSARKGDVIFLCGSSGDGKSEILTRYYEEFHHNVCFHLDATHSFSPQQSAIEALDQLFDHRLTDCNPLVIGVNIGMLANYGQEGAPRHGDVKAAIEQFLSHQPTAQNFIFLDFEKYPKFSFSSGVSTYSVFAKRLMTRLTERCSENPFYQLALQDEQAQRDLRLIANFALLSRESVQDTIISNLFRIRLERDQFITTRALLDLLHHLLLGDSYLPDNLFAGDDGELAQRLSASDPAVRRTRKLDQFVLRFELELPDAELEQFLTELSASHLYYSRNGDSNRTADSLIRLFYVLRSEDIGNNYHKQFSDDFSDNSLDRYADIWLLHDSFDGNEAKRTKLRNFYVNELVAAVFNYANRNAPKLRKGELFLGKFGEFELAAPVELKGDYQAVSQSNRTWSAHFSAHLKVFDTPLEPVVISFCLYELITKLNKGYRPNKYDKSAVVLLDEIIDQVAEIAKTSPRLKIYTKKSSFTLIQDDEMIAVSEV